MTDTVLFADNVYGTIASGLSTSDTSIALTSGHGARFPTVGANQILYATLLNSANVLEEIHITTHTASSDTLTVTRAANSTTAKSWTAGDRIECRLTSEHLSTLRDIVASTNTWTKAQRGAPVALTSTSGAVAVDLSAANNFTLAMTENATLGSATNVAAGQAGAVVVTQNSTAAYTLSYSTSFWKGPSGVYPTISTSLGSVNLLSYYTEASTRATILTSANDSR